MPKNKTAKPNKVTTKFIAYRHVHEDELQPVETFLQNKETDIKQLWNKEEWSKHPGRTHEVSKAVHKKIQKESNKRGTATSIQQYTFKYKILSGASIENDEERKHFLTHLDFGSAIDDLLSGRLLGKNTSTSSGSNLTNLNKSPLLVGSKETEHNKYKSKVIAKIKTILQDPKKIQDFLVHKDLAVALKEEDWIYIAKLSNDDKKWKSSLWDILTEGESRKKYSALRSELAKKGVLHKIYNEHLEKNAWKGKGLHKKILNCQRCRQLFLVKPQINRMKVDWPNQTKMIIQAKMTELALLIRLLQKIMIHRLLRLIVTKRIRHPAKA